MGLFVGRGSELEKLNSVYGKGKAVLIYGRRRIGKSTLIDRFCEGRRSLHLTCIDSTLRSNLDYIHRMVSNFRGEDSGEYRDYLDMKDDLARICSDGNNILVIDEYQYLVKADDSIDSFMQQLIDETLKHTESTLILCGSSVTVMKSTGEDGSHPLYGRFRHRIYLMPLSMEECRTFHPDMSDHDQMMMYLTFGGIPRYHEESEEESYEDFFRRNCIEDTWIADEALFLLKVDYPNSQECDAVLSAIAGGSVRPKEIQERSGIGTKYVDVVKRLLENDVIGVVHPMLGAPSRPVYYIRDRFLAFYYSVVRYRQYLFLHGDSAKAYDELYPYIKTHIGKMFELHCQDIVCREYPVLEIGRWWMDDPKRDIHEAIDIVAKVSEGRSRVDLIAECKFTSKKVGFTQYNDLERRAARFSDNFNMRLMIISESGFEGEFREFAESTGVMLIGPEELYGHRQFPEIPL